MTIDIKPSAAGGAGKPAAAAAVDPREISVALRDDGQYEAAWNEQRTVVKVCRCFPWTDPHHYISLRDVDDHEVAFITDLSVLDEASRRVVERALYEASFVLEITRVLHLEEEYEIRTWKVETEQGPRSFQTKRDEWPQPVARGGLLIRDVAGDLFYIRDPDTLDPASRKRLSVYID